MRLEHVIVKTVNHFATQWNRLGTLWGEEVGNRESGSRQGQGFYEATSLHNQAYSSYRAGRLVSPVTETYAGLEIAEGFSGRDNIPDQIL